MSKSRPAASEGPPLHDDFATLSFANDDPPPPSAMASGVAAVSGAGRTRGVRLSARTTEAIAAIQCDEFSDPLPVRRPRQSKSKSKAKPAAVSKAKEAVTVDDDEEDADFVPGEDNGGSDVSSSEEDEEMDGEVEVTNVELADALPSQIEPAMSAKARSKRRRQTLSTSEPQAKRPRETDLVPNPASATPATSRAQAKPKGKRNPIYLFYERVSTDANNESIDGTEYYKCYHGNRKIMKITASMRNNTNGLVQHMKSNFPWMYRLYEVLKERSEPPTPKEVDIAAGKIQLNSETVSAFITGLENQSVTIKAALQRQADQAKPKWDQATFERYLIEWIVACDQPFTEVERPEFIRLLQYIFERGGGVTPFHIPGRTTVQKKVMKEGEDTINETRDMFEALESDVTIALDAWTSPNQHAFLAIVAHFITNDGQLRELLIDFKELIGKHTGERSFRSGDRAHLGTSFPSLCECLETLDRDNGKARGSW